MDFRYSEWLNDFKKEQEKKYLAKNLFNPSSI